MINALKNYFSFCDISLLFQPFNIVKMTYSTINDWITFAKDAIKKPIENLKTCPICLEDFKPSKELKLEQCMHYICSGCRDSVINRCDICPLCRKPFKRELPMTYGWGVDPEPISPYTPMPEAGEEPWNQPEELSSWFKDSQQRYRQQNRNSHENMWNDFFASLHEPCNW